MDEPLVRTKDKIWTTGDLLSALRQVGVEEGDDICVHSDIFVLGPAAMEIKRRSDIMSPLFLGRIIEALRRALGESGTLIMPTFTYSFCKGEIYDRQRSPSTVGVLTEYYRRMPNTRRTRDPIFSFAVSGARENEYLDISDSCFGQNSVFDKLYSNKAKIVFLGAGPTITYLHYIEKRHGVPYRYDKNFSGTVRDNGSEYAAAFTFFVRDLARRSIADEAVKLDFFKKTNNYRAAAFGEGRVIAIDARKLCDDVLDELARNPLFLLGE